MKPRKYMLYYFRTMMKQKTLDQVLNKETVRKILPFNIKKVSEKIKVKKSYFFKITVFSKKNTKPQYP